MTSQELLLELNNISSIMSDAEITNNNRDGELAINNLLNLLRSTPIEDISFDFIITDILKKYNSLYNTSSLLRQKKKEIMDSYKVKNKERAKEVMEEVLQYQKDNKLNSLEFKIFNDIKFYIKYIDPEYYKERLI